MNRRPVDDRARLLERIALWEPSLGALVSPDAVTGTDVVLENGPLAGVLLGVKDVIDVAGLPTRNGSAACADAPPAASDAPVVAFLRAAGARIVGKTATTEFAFTDPTSTTNPFDPRRTPGGSSSGSGAAVGAGMLDLAVGTQTAGSLIRPAAYCGAVAFKPSLGRLPTTGMTPLAPSFDTIGFIARDVALAIAAFRACGGEEEPAWALSGLRVGIAAVDPGVPMQPEAREALRAACRVLATAGARPAAFDPAISLADVVADHRVVMLFEMAQAHAARLAPRLADLRPRFHGALRDGAAISLGAAIAARDRLASARAAFWEAARGYDVLIAPPTPGAAPERDGTTGFQHMLTPWTVFAGPLVALPWGSNSDGLPLSVMLAAPPGDDGRVLAIADALARLAPRLREPRPT